MFVSPDVSPIVSFGSGLPDNFGSDLSLDKSESNFFSGKDWNLSELLVFLSASPNMFLSFYV